MKTVSEVLTEARRKAGVGLEEIERVTKIRKAVLEALEQGDYKKLPAPIYIKGLINNYGRYLGLNVAELQALFRREYDQKNNLKLGANLNGIKKPFFVLTPTVVIASFIILSVSAVSFYLYQQYNLFTAAPKLVVDEPGENFRTTNSAVNVVGYTYPEAVLKINGQPIQLSTGGNFVVSVDLPLGTNILNITSENKFGKMSLIKRAVIVEQIISSEEAVLPGVASASASVSAVLTPSELEKVELAVSLSIGPSSAWVKVEVDGENKFEGVLVNGVTKNFSGESMVKVKTGNAGSTKIVVNGKDEGVLGKENEIVEKQYSKN